MPDDAFAELASFTAECTAIDATLAEVPPDAWDRPALGEWTLHELAAHLVGGAARLHEYAAEDPGPTAPACDRVGYFAFDLAAEAPAVAERARRRAAQVPADEIPTAFREAWRTSAAKAADLGPDALMKTLRGPMRVREYLATRVLEMVVHHMDVRSALDLPQASTPDAARLVMELLEGLLGEPRPRNLGRTRFIQVATGRVASDDGRFPVLR
jgi:uncharacterized protein (TIGR03083 family)